MANMPVSRASRPACLTALAIAVALVMVPAVMRAMQHIELHDGTRLSIKLNWQGDAPPQKALFSPDHRASSAVVPPAFAQQPHPARVVSRAPSFDEPPVAPPFDNSPDLLRGPPESNLLASTASVAV